MANRGADFSARDNFALRCAIDKNHINVVQYLLSLGAYHPHIGFNLKLVNDLYSSGYFDAVHKLLFQKKLLVSVDQIDQFNIIKKSVNKIIESRKWNESLLKTLNYSNVLFHF